MKFWVFLVAAVVSLPKQLVSVYIGVALNSSESSVFAGRGIRRCTDPVYRKLHEQQNSKNRSRYYDCHYHCCYGVHPAVEDGRAAWCCIRSEKGTTSEAGRGLRMLLYERTTRQIKLKKRNPAQVSCRLSGCAQRGFLIIITNWFLGRITLL